MNSWFAEALRAEIASRCLSSQADLAKLVGKPTATVSRWLSGERLPAFNDLNEVATRLGWDLARAMPTYEVENAPAMEILGRVAAGGEAIVYEDLERVHPQKDIWETSRAAPHGYGPVQYLRIAGESMEPDYPPGSLIAVRRSNLKPWNLPQLTPAILVPRSSRDSATFKLVQTKYDQKGQPVQVLGVPINRSFEVLIWDPDKVAVAYVVLGKVEVWQPAGRSVNGLLLKEETKDPHAQEPHQ